MERAHLAAEYFFSVLLSIAADAEKRGCQRRNGILDGRLSKRQVGIYQKSRHCRVSGISQQYRLFRIESGKKHHHEFTEVFDGAWKRICVRCPTAAYSYGKTGLLHRSRVLQLHPEVLCPDRSETSKVSHQDVGQMDMYVRMYDELKRTEGDNPTIGIILCSDTDEDIARYSILKGNEQLFASKYKLYLPTEEELRNEIETQKMMFYLQYDLGGLENGNG